MPSGGVHPITQRFRRQIREQAFAFRYAHNGE
jgi:hypothetical protein